MLTSMLRCRTSFRRPAALLAVAALLVMPIAAGAAPADSHAAASWSWSWQGLVDQVAAWLPWAQPAAGRAPGGAELGSTQDPDGREAAPGDPTASYLVPGGETTELGSTLDPDGNDAL